MPIPITEKLIQRQINHWNSFRQFLREPPSPEDAPRGPIITLSRMAGSGGRALAGELAERLALHLHDHSMVEKIARDARLEKDLVAQLDEKEVTQAQMWVRGVLDQRIFMRSQYHLALVKVVTSLAAKGSALFLGRGANFILGRNANLRLRLVGSHQIRLENIRQRTGLSRPEARAMMEETDRHRDEFIRKVFREEPNQSEHFDMVLNTDRLPLECQVELVLLALLEQQTRGKNGADINEASSHQTAKS